MFINLVKDVFGITPDKGVVQQVSSFGKRRSKLAFGSLAEFDEKCVNLRPGEDFTCADIEGPAVISRIWVTLPYRFHYGSLRNLVLRIYWDGEAEPSVYAPLGDFFGTTFDRPFEYSSAYLSITSGAFLSFFPMPFKSRAVIKVENQSRLPVSMFFYQITYLKLREPLGDSTPLFHCVWNRKTMKRKEDPFPVLEARGKGFYIGCHLNMTGNGYPWRLNPVLWQMPEGFGLGMLEGWERIWIDGADVPQVHGTGGEDYFNGAWYFKSVPCTTLTHGVTLRSYLTRRVSCYRFHAEMPVWFNSGVKVTIDHGINNALPATYEGTAYWYQSEPHEPFGEMPPAGQRRPQGRLKNLLIMGAPVGYAALGLGLGRLIKKGKS